MHLRPLARLLGGFAVASAISAEPQAAEGSISSAVAPVTTTASARTLNALAQEQQSTDLPRARATAEQALAAARRDGDADQELDALRRLSDIARRQGHYPDSFRYARLGLKQATAAGNEGRRADFLTQIGAAYWLTGEFAKAMETHQEAYRVAEKMNDRLRLAAALVNLGVVSKSAGNPAAALDYALKTVAALEGLGEDARMAMALNNAGVAQQALGNLASARELFEQSLALKLKQNDKRSIAAAYVNLGSVSAATGALDEALTLHRQALALRREVGDQRGIANSLALVGETLTSLGRAREALPGLQEASAIAERLGSPDVRFNVQRALSGAHAAAGNPAAALTALRAALESREQQLNEQVQERVVEMQKRFDLERKEREIDLLKRDQAVQAAELRAKESQLQAIAEREARQRSQRNALLAVLLLGAIAAAALISRHNVKRRAAQKILEETRAAKEQAERANELKTRLLGVASHDLKDPLSAIIGAAGLIRSPSADAPRPEEMAGWIESEGQRLLRLVLDLVDTAALEVGKLQLNRSRCDLAPLVRGMVEEFEVRARPKDQRITFTALAGGPYLISGDAARLRQVFGNVLGNALKFTPRGRAVHVSLTAVSTGVRCYVRDEGPGLKPEDASRLFQRFERLSARPTAGESSTGLGLSIADEIVSLHGGKIWSESNPGEGATFVIEFPALAPAPVAAV